MGEKTWERKFRNTVVCIDSYENSVPAGQIFNLYMKAPKPFYGVVQFLKSMEELLNEMKMPRAFTETRTFSAAVAAEETPDRGSDPERQQGELATFAINIIFRQNASWQGSVSWMEGKQEESFRSVLELICLMDSALCAVAESRKAV